MRAKLISFFLLTITLWFSTTAKAVTTETDENGIVWQQVTNPSEFRTAVKSNANVWVMQDIDLSLLTPEESDLLFDSDLTFTGRIKGKHTDLQGNETLSQLMNCRVILFEKMEGATISDLVFTNCYFDGWDSGSGQLAATANNCQFTNIVLINCKSKGDRDSIDCDQMGGLIGEATDCSFTLIQVFDSELETDGQCAGLVVGKAVGCSFDHCFTNFACNLWADGNSAFLGIEGYAHAGGICGYAENTTFSGCVNLALVSSFDDSIGGIVGYGTGVTMTDCTNSGIVCHNNRDGYETMKDRKSTYGKIACGALIGGVAGYLIFGSLAVYVVPAVIAGYFIMGSALAVVALVAGVACLSAYIVSLNYEPDEMGGIAGTVVSNSSIKRCTNYGPIMCFDAYAGGIVGYASGSTIECCISKAFVSSQEQAGGIVGKIVDCTLRYNLNMGVVKTDLETQDMIVAVKSGSNTIAKNYFLDSINKDYGQTTAVTQDKLASGQVALNLNTACGSGVFRQDLGKSIYPSLDTSYSVVTDTTSNYNLWHKVSTAEDFLFAVTNLTAKIELTNDIDLSSNVLFGLFSVQHPFQGEIKGNGFSLKNGSYLSTENRNDDDLPQNAAFFAYAKNAIFEDFTIDNIHIGQKDEANVVALLVAESNNCSYTDIRLRNSSIYKNNDGDELKDVGGLVAHSSGDRFLRCTAESSCRFEGYAGVGDNDTNVGGIAGKASGSMFTQCHNAASIWSDDNNEGGICGHAGGCGFISCLNTGQVTGETNVGGIAGYAGSCEIKKCVNVGTIYGDKGDGDNDHIAGIVGTLENPISRVEYCLSFGALKDIDSDDTNGAIIGEWIDKNDANYVCNLYNYSHKGQNRNNLSDFGYTDDDVLSGKVAYEFKATNDETPRFLYQSLDNDPYCTKLPVPIPAAGEVFLNSLCSVDMSSHSLFAYSNIMHSTSMHDRQGTDKWGFCTVCGSRWKVEVPATIEIASAADLVTLSKGVRMGVNYSNTDITLTGDLDFEGITDYMPIGTSIERPYSGFFYGNGHHIKNLHIKRTSEQTGVGLFGVVTGETRIDGIIMDQSCSIDGVNSLGVGGLVGCVMTSTASQNGRLQVYNCGNEATVHGGENVAGLVGGVYDKAHDGSDVIGCRLTIGNCYNAGSISGTKVCAALVGYAHLWVQAYNCFNIGNVSGYNSGHHMIHYNKEKADEATFSRLYQLEGLPADENIKATATAEQFFLGYVADKLNYNEYVENSHWHQNLGTDEYPTPLPTPNASGKTIYHERSMSRDWGTAILPYNVQSNNQVLLYALESTDLTSADATITLKVVESVAANAPFFFKKKVASATSVSFNIAAEDDITLPADNAASVTMTTDVPGWSLTGTYAGKSDLKDVYFMAQDQLWFAEDAIEVPSFRSYLTYDASTVNQPASLRILVNEEGESTQIGEIRDGELHFYDDGKYFENGRVVIRKGGKTYDTQGQQISPVPINL